MITLQLLCVKINVLSSQHPMFSVTPGCSAECEIYVGLIMQYHYVGLGTISVEQSTQPDNSSSNDTDNASVADEILDDATIKEGDEHRRKISGAPRASMMCVENPRDIAPAEGEKSLNIMTE